MRKAIHSLNISRPLATHLPIVIFGIFLCLTVFLADHTFAAVQSGTSSQGKAFDKASVVQKASKLQIPFIANEGQIDRRVRFYGQTFGGNFYLTEGGDLVYTFSIPDSKEKIGRHSKILRRMRILSIREQLVGASQVSSLGIGRAPAKINYFTGNDHSNWKTNIPTYNSVSLGNVYEGIELSLKAYGDNVEKIFTVQPGADFNKIRLRIAGAINLNVNNQGELEIKSLQGAIRFSQPLAYQDKNGKRQPVRVAYRVRDNTYGFKVTGHDPALPLIIDPCLSYSTYLGGAGEDGAFAVAADADGNAYVAGFTLSDDFPVFTDTQDSIAGNYDGFVAKFDRYGSMIYSTYLGGELDDLIYAIAVEPDGSAYVTGETGSKRFPVKSYYNRKIGGNSDLFVTKFGPAGEMIYSTYLGGGGPEIGHAIAVDAGGFAYVAGQTQSSNYPVTPEAYSTNAGNVDAFVTKLNQAGNALIYSTILGGSGADFIRGIAIDQSGSAYVTGQTASTNFSTTIDAYDTVLGGPLDAFVAKLNPDASNLEYSTYFGGNGEDIGNAVAVDYDGNAYVAGQTLSGNFPTSNAFQGSKNEGWDAFVAKLDPDGFPGYSTYLGGSGDDEAYGITLNEEETDQGTKVFAYVAGETFSEDLPVTHDSVNSGASDVFLAKLGEDDPLLFYLTLLGGSGEDSGQAMALSPYGIFLTGFTLSTDFPVIGTPEQDTAGGDYDAFLVIAGNLDQEDPDNDELANIDECEYGTDPNNPDTDGDGMPDGWEVRYGLDPLDPTDFDDDPDGDGWTNLQEYQADKHPKNPQIYPTGADFTAGIQVSRTGGDDRNLGNAANPVRSIRAGVKRSNLLESEGHTIHVESGTYSLDETVTVVQNVTIIGSSGGTIISGGAVRPIGWQVSPGVSNLTFQDLTIEKFKIGIVITGNAACIKLINVDIQDCNTGIRLVEAYQVTIEMGQYLGHDFYQSRIENCDRGIEIREGSSNNIIRNGLIENNRIDGIAVDGSLESPDSNLIETMKITGNTGNGIIFLAGFYNEVVNSIITGNGDKTGIIPSGFGGVAIFNGTAALHWNEIHSNECWDVYTEDALAGSTIDASFNWWDKEDGPEVNQYGIPVKISEHVRYKHWLPYADLWIGRPLQPDTDGDGLGDQWEVDHLLDPAENDSNFDGIPDGEEDLDGDGLSNRQEYQGNPDEDTGEYPQWLYVGFDGFEEASDYNVGNPRFPLKTLHEAAKRVNNAQNNATHSIYLATGDYSKANGEADQPLVLNQNIEIIGSGSSETYLNGTMATSWTTGIILSPGVTTAIIEGLTIKGFAAGAGIRQTTDGACVNLYDVVITESKTGFQLVDSYQARVDFGQSEISHNYENGIEILGGSSHNSLFNAWIHDNEKNGVLVDTCQETTGETPDNNVIAMMRIEHNDLSGVVLNGIDNQVLNSIIESNNITAQGIAGIAVTGGSATLNWNSLVGNQGNGVYAADAVSTPVNAKYNWWGDATGPSGSGDGLGDGVSENVIYEPWIDYRDPWIGKPLPRDSDDDGMGDEWEKQHLLDPYDDGDADLDSDGDGATNAQEYQSGTNPLDPDSSPTFTSLYVGFEGFDPADDDNIGTPRFPLSTLHTTLHEAIERVNLLPDDNYKVYIAPGIYAESNSGEEATEPPEPLVIQQNVVIYGDGQVILDGQDAIGWTTAFSVSSGVSKVGFEGLTIQNFKTGIQVNTSAACVDLSGVTIQGGDRGLQFAESYQVTTEMHQTVITATRIAGIHMAAGSSHNVVSNGVILSNLGDGILVDGSRESPDYNLFRDLQIQDNGGNGVLFFAGFGNQIVDSLIQGNSILKGYGGIAILNDSASVKYCEIKDNSCGGIFVDEAVDVEIEGNLITGHTNGGENPQAGVKLSFTRNTKVKSNTITENDAGLVIEQGSSPTIRYNILYGNDTDLSTPYDPTVAEEEIDLDYTIIQFNNIGSTSENLRWLPASNIPWNPILTTYALDPGSPAIDATGETAAGRDIDGTPRPQGSSWDMGAFESKPAADADNDGFPDAWEEKYFGTGNLGEINDPNGDYDGDGISNWNEFLAGSSPVSKIDVRITFPVASPYYTNEATIELAGTSAYADSIKVNGSSVIGDLDSWQAVVNLDSGSRNLINVTASAAGEPSVTTSLEVVTLDSADPELRITFPTHVGAYTTTLSAITLRGLATDDTQVKSVSWSREVKYADGSVTPMDTGLADGTTTWTAASIALEPGSDVINVITVTAKDHFDKQRIDQIEVTMIDEDTTHSSVPLTGLQPAADPTDPDGDKYLSDDERACGSSPDDPASMPDNPMDNYYPENHPNAGYKWPACLNPDNDFDGLPDSWEIQNHTVDTTVVCELNPYSQDSDEDGNPDGQEDCEPDGFDNLSEYQNGTDPTIVQKKAFEVTLHDMTSPSADITETWLPEYNTTVLVRARWIGEGEAPVSAVIKLSGTSNYPGRAVNDPDPAEVGANYYEAWYQYHGPDFGLTADPADHAYDQGPVPVSGVQAGDGTWYYEIYLKSWDYGGRTRLIVTNPDPGHEDDLGLRWAPQGSANNGIAAAWSYENEVAPLDPNGDIDHIVFDPNQQLYTAPLGDDFNNFEEFRGILHTVKGQPGLIHERLSPHEKDLFIRAEGFAADWPSDLSNPNLRWPFAIGEAYSRAGIKVWNTTDWGHDATEDDSFFIYYKRGIVTNISGKTVNGDPDTGWSSGWPKHEWEFRLDADAGNNDAWTPVRAWLTPEELYLDYEYRGLGTSGSYRIRKPLPHINVLIVYHDTTTRAVFPGEDGNIRFISASTPGQDNLLGERFWTWSSKGVAFTNITTDKNSMYGLAIGLQIPTYNMFYQKPYIDDNDDRRLNPLRDVDDYRDLGGADSGDSWNGDYRTYDPLNWLQPDRVSPFDIDGDGWVELPTLSNPEDATPGVKKELYEYSLPEVWLFLITHEMGHALGGPSHTDIPEGLMSRYSYSWRTHNYLSNYYRSLLRVHNLTR